LQQPVLRLRVAGPLLLQLRLLQRLPVGVPLLVGLQRLQQRLLLP
jgi:hypothetical protein